MSINEIRAKIQQHMQQKQQALYLILDIDGTLCDFQNNPEQCHIRPEIIYSLKQLLCVPGLQLCLLTGRAYASAKRLCSDLKIPICSEHGLEQYTADGQCIRRYQQSGDYSLLISNVEQLHQHYPHLRIEHKQHGVALHFREHPELVDLVQKFVSTQLQQCRGYIEKRGNHVVEIAPEQANKGHSIRYLLAEHSHVAAVYIGDDITDEDAFQALNELDGISIKVGTGNTAAQYRLDNIDQVALLLKGLVDMYSSAELHA